AHRNDPAHCSDHRIRAAAPYSRGNYWIPGEPHIRLRAQPTGVVASWNDGLLDAQYWRYSISVVLGAVVCEWANGAPVVHSRVSAHGSRMASVSRDGVRTAIHLCRTSYRQRHYAHDHRATHL